MSIAVSCQCGARFKADVALAGQQKNCPKCRGVITIPQAVATSSSQPQGLVAACQCGKRFKAPATMAGRRVAYPACGQAINVPSTAGASANPAPPDPLGGVSDDLWNSAPADSPLGTPLTPAQPLGQVGGGYAAPQAKRKTSFRIQPWMIFTAVGVAALCVIGVGVSSLIGWLGDSERDTTAGLSSSQAADLPTNADELAEFVESGRDSPDTTAIWRRAIDQVSDLKGRPGAGLLTAATGRQSFPAIPAPGQRWLHRQSAERVVSGQTEVLRLLHEAAAGKGSPRLLTDFSQGAKTDLSDIQKLQTAASLLSLETHVHAHRGNKDEALKSMAAIFAIARVLEKEPFLVTYLLRLAVVRATCHLTATIVPHMDFSEQQLDELDRLLGEVDLSSSFQRAFITECSIGIMGIRDPALLDGVIDPSVASQISGSREKDLEYYTSVMRRAAEAAKLSAREAYKSAVVISADQNELTSADAATRQEHVLSMLLVPPIKTAFAANAQTVAMRDAARIALRLAGHHQSHGSYPSELTQAGYKHSELPSDPFVDHALRYKATGDGFVIYSVGSDGQDNGGKGSIASGSDIVFRVSGVRSS